MTRLVGSRVELRPPTDGDASAWARWFDDLGVRRQARRIAGSWHDVVLMELRAEQWRGGPGRRRLQSLTPSHPEAARA